MVNMGKSSEQMHTDTHLTMMYRGIHWGERGVILQNECDPMHCELNVVEVMSDKWFNIYIKTMNNLNEYI